MEIINEKPPFYQKILDAGLVPSETTIFTYGDKIYNPSGAELSNDIIVHEETHYDQQGDDPDAWWKKYLTDASFRLEQEAEAYGEQYRFICKTTMRDREKRNGILLVLAYHLCGPMYGKIITHMEAYKLIKKKS